ncbi:MAG: tRNA lysidine(34) synthetase TilS [Alphaproteobacteria bacterium]|nr:tRNA lysidine(34) synthetase TilS [Alphaproteobacteria bacterium]
MSALEKKFEDEMQALFSEQPDKIAVAVSGGADSLCLTLLLKKWADKNRVKLYAFTVDHGLRSESSKEASAVHLQLKKLGFIHQVLKWSGKKPKTRVEELARQARYDLLQKACQKNKIQYLFLAHHIEDQCETFWARFAHKSGLDGLCAMQKKSDLNGLILVRPLLDVSKKEIVEYLKKNKISWVEDPMNYSPLYERVLWRGHQKSLSEMGLTPATINVLTKRLTRVKQAVDFYTNAFIKNSVLLSPVGYAFIGKMAWEMAPMEIRLRTLLHLLPLISGQDKIVSLESVEKLLNSSLKSATLAGCQIIFHKKGIFIAREMRQITKSMKLKKGKSAYWDRFFIFSPVATTLSHQAPKKRIKDLPFLVQKTFPNADYNKVHYSIDESCFCGLYFPEVPVLGQKELEKKAYLDYKKGNKTLFIHFNPRIQK